MPYADPEKRRAYERARRERLWLASLVCPECLEKRSTPETLRVHRWLAHDVKDAPAVAS